MMLLLLLPSLKELKVKSLRTASVKTSVEIVLQCCKLEQNGNRLKVFATSYRLTETIGSVFKSPKLPLSKQKEKMWRMFGRVREFGLWQTFFARYRLY